MQGKEGDWELDAEIKKSYTHVKNHAIHTAVPYLLILSRLV